MLKLDSGFQKWYYPFGLTFNEYKREGSLENKFEFQGQEHQDDLELGWVQFKWRNHDPALGRFFNVDPLADTYVHNSTYAFAENKVIANIELEGLEAYPGGEVLMIRRQMEQSGATKEELADYDEGVKQSFFTGLGFSPVDAAVDIYEGYQAVKEGDYVGAGLSALAVFGFDIIKDGKKLLNFADEAGDAARELSRIDNSDLIKELQLSDGMSVSSNEALELAERYLGKGYKEVKAGSGRYMSADGTRIVRMGESDITGAHGGGPHMNFETLVPNPDKPGKVKVETNLHIYLNEK